MAELAGLGVAANVAQFVILGFQATHYLYQAYSKSDEFLKEHRELEAIARNIQFNSQTLLGAPATTWSAELKTLSSQAETLAKDLVSELEKISRCASKGGRLAKWELGIRALLAKPNTEQLMSRLVKLRDQMSYQLVQLSHQSQTEFIGRSDELNSKTAHNSTEMMRELQELHSELAKIHEAALADSNADFGPKFEAMTSRTIKTVEHCLLRKRVEHILESLRFDAMSTRKSDIPQAHKKTFQWSLSTDRTNLAEWFKEEHGIYWIQGKAGSGKSTLMKYLQTDSCVQNLLETWAGQSRLLIISHYFWAPGTELQKSLIGLFRTLLFQIFMQDPELVASICPSRMTTTNYQHLEPWTLEDLKECFSSLSNMERLPRKLCIFVDGLDEFQGEHSDLSRFLWAMVGCQDIKLCVSSRPWVHFQQSFGHLSSSICVENFTKEDIDTYVRDNLRSNRQYVALCNGFPDQTERLAREIAEAADGVFLWVYLVTREILRGLTNYDDVSTLQERLRNMPRDLEEYFRRMLCDIEPVYHYDTSALFSILAFEHCSLDTELTWALRLIRLKKSSANSHALLRRESNDATSYRWTRTIPLMVRDAEELMLPMYDAYQEKTIVVARCKDLIHVAKDISHLASGNLGFRLGFLHRTVVEFLNMKGTKTILKQRLEKRDAGVAVPKFIVPLELARAHLQLLEYSPCRQKGVPYPMSTFEVSTSKMVKDYPFNWIIYLAKQSRLHSSVSSISILHELGYLAGAHPGGLVGIALPIELDQVSPPYQRFALSVSYLGASLLKNNAELPHIHISKLSLLDYQATLAVLTCRQCLKAARFLRLEELLYVFMQRQWLITLDSSNELLVTQGNAADLESIKMIAGELKFRSSTLGPHTWCRFWSLIVRIQNKHPHLLPENVYSICQVLIRYGAPRMFKCPTSIGCSYCEMMWKFIQEGVHSGDCPPHTRRSAIQDYSDDFATSVPLHNPAETPGEVETSATIDMVIVLRLLFRGTYPAPTWEDEFAQAAFPPSAPVERQPELPDGASSNSWWRWVPFIGGSATRKGVPL